MQNSPLKELVEIQSGFAFRSECFNSEGIGMPLVRIRDVLPGKTDTYYDGPYDEQFVITDDQILIGMDGEFNCARWKGGRSLLNQRVCRIQPKNGNLDSEYLYRFLPAALKHIESRTSFVTVKHLSSKDIFAIEIPLPPINEQRRIATIVDQADDLRRHRRDTLNRVDNLTEATFEHIFGDPIRNPKFWQQATLKDIVGRIQIGPFGSLLHKEDYVFGGVPLINPMHIFDGTLQPDPKYSVSPAKHAALSLYQLQRGDVVMGRRGEMGRCAIVSNEQDGYICGTGSLFIRPVEELATATFLFFVLSSVGMKRRLEELSLGATLPNLNTSIVETLPIPLPPITLQRDFAARITEIEKLKIGYCAHLAKLDALFASLQHRAFRGEL
jgi:type I restriction enzyme, S subunit